MRVLPLGRVFQLDAAFALQALKWPQLRADIFGELSELLISVEVSVQTC